MASQAWRPKRKHLTAADFDDSEFDSCFHVYASEYMHLGTCVSLYIKLHGVGPDSPEIYLAKEFLERTCPVLAAPWMTFEIGFTRTALIWLQHTDSMPEGGYDEWRFFAWAIFDEVPDMLIHCGFHLQGMSVEPLPGPWRWQFL
jgi:hypothetical protein